VHLCRHSTKQYLCILFGNSERLGISWEAVSTTIGSCPLEKKCKVRRTTEQFWFIVTPPSSTDASETAVAAATPPDTDSDEDVAIRILMPTTHRRGVIPDLFESWSGSEIVADAQCLCELTLRDISLHLLAVLKHVIHADVQRASETSACMHLAPAVGATLCTVINQLCSSGNASPYPSYSNECLFTICRLMVRIFFLMLLRIGEQTNGLATLRRCSAITDSASIMFQNVGKLCESEEGLQLVYDYTAACWLYARGLLLYQQSNAMIINAALKAIEMVTSGYGRSLTAYIFVRLSQHSVNSDTNRLPALTELLKSVVGVSHLLKSIRSVYVHMCTCVLRSHHSCISANTKSRHHHDVLGSPLSGVYCCDKDSVLNEPVDVQYNTPADTCIISSIVLLVLQVYRQTENDCLRYYLLEVLEGRSVMCCCVPPIVLIESLCSSFKPSVPEASSQWHAVSSLVNILLSDCCTNSKADRCSVCNVDKVDSEEDFSSEGALSSDSALSGCCPTRSYASRWSCLSIILKMLHSSNLSFAVHLLTQMLRLVENGTEVLRHQLYIDVFIPVFKSLVQQLLPAEKSAHNIVTELSDCSLFVNEPSCAAKICLCALSSLLHDAPARTHFVSSGYVNVIIALSSNENVFGTVALPYFRNWLQTATQ
jgi:hypothetical protein